MLWKSSCSQYAKSSRPLIWQAEANVNGNIIDGCRQPKVKITLSNINQRVSSNLSLEETIEHYFLCVLEHYR